MLSPSANQVTQYHVFLSSPGDVKEEREHVKTFFERYNRQTAQLWNVRFEVIDWANSSTIGVGRPQELITQQTLEKYRQSLILVIGIMGQRFGSHTGKAESGTEEEFNWAMENYSKSGFPEIKWFFKKIETLEIPPDLTKAKKAMEQWEKVLKFRQRMQEFNNPIFYTEYPSAQEFSDIFDHDLNVWLADSSRFWVSEKAQALEHESEQLSPPDNYYKCIEHDFHRLDIAGIDNDRAFEIPLSEIYVRLRVMFDEDTTEETEIHESGSIGIQTALRRYPKLVIVGDPGSGKSTFLKYISLMLARSFLTGRSGIAMEKLCLQAPLPIPIFLSCWDLSDFLKQRNQIRVGTLLEFILERFTAYEFSVSVDDVEQLLYSGNCCLLFDGLDEVPTDKARATVSRLIEDSVRRYGNNRFVVTSRVRAYTGDTILKGQFTRCDIQPFNPDDRMVFLRNWVALLFRVLPEKVDKDINAAREFKSLLRGIETNDRIRPLAINPLLLTVIAIVHWNRKRLPEQRVDLYDECVDVLLGQRKEAEHIQQSRKIEVLDENTENHNYEERAWIRKRFAEIALYIICQYGDHTEAAKSDIVKLLGPRFIDKGALNDEQAAFQAELFLDRQELRSGLLVSRRALSYRFVHLTFQEYLAAWQLSNLEFGSVMEIIRPNLRVAKWFETLQLLGGQWAKESDEKVDQYINWLLENRNSRIKEQAPIVALCANIIKDIIGVAEIKKQTRQIFRKAVEETLDAFNYGSGVQAETQLEILEALGQLGAVVKSHLINATNASLYQVRCRAIEILLPHLSDDELFGLKHLLNDRSRKSIKNYLVALGGRDQKRLDLILEDQAPVTDKLCEAIFELSTTPDILSERLTWKFLVNYSLSECSPASVRIETIRFLADRFLDQHTKITIENRAANDIDRYVRKIALETVAEKWALKENRTIFEDRAINDGFHKNRCLAIRTLAKNWPDDRTRKILQECFNNDEIANNRNVALKALISNWRNQNMRTSLEDKILKNDRPEDRYFMLSVLAATWSDEQTRKIVEDSIYNEKEVRTRRQILEILIEQWLDENTKKIVIDRAANDVEEWIRNEALRILVDRWLDEDTWEIIKDLSITDKSDLIRIDALEELANNWPDMKTKQHLMNIAVNDKDEDVRDMAVLKLNLIWPHREWSFKSIVKMRSSKIYS